MVAVAWPSRAREMTDVEVAWVAGLLEGEGSFITRNVRGYHRSRISMQSTDLDVLQRLQTVTGVGNISSVIRRPGRKDCWGWYAEKLNEAVPLIQKLYPYMGSRRQEQIEFVLSVHRAPFSRNRP